VRVAHVLTYVSQDAAYGGPLAVASVHCRELARRGHEVELFAGWDGVAVLDVPGVRTRLYKVRRVLPIGFSGLVAPRLVLAVLRRAKDLDVVHVHLGRDLVTLLTALLITFVRDGPRLYVQTHGMVAPDRRLSARIADVAVRRVLRRSRGVFALHLREAARVGQVADAPVPVTVLPNGVPLQKYGAGPSEGVPEVLFMARLHPRKRVMVFAEAARLVLASDVQARFGVVGPDEGELPALRAFCADHDLQDAVVYEGSVPPGRGPERLSRADLYVLPSLREPFPMTVLEALSVGVPSVVSADCQVAEELVANGGVETFDGGAEELSEVLRSLLLDPTRRARLAREALRSIATTFGITTVVDKLEQCYSGAGADRPLRVEERA